MNLTDISLLKFILKSNGIRIKKRFGQHFLIDNDALEKIVASADLTFGDVVLEIGPGLGVLTSKLVKKVGKAVAVEFDPGMIKILRQTVKADNLEIIEENILEMNLNKLPLNYKVVANLPYYITSPILRLFLEIAKNKPKEMVLLIQNEVAKRLTAKPGNMSILAVSVQFYGKPEIIDYVSKTSFWPEPKVNSAIIKITPFDKPLFDVDIKLFFRIVKAGFGEKRKQLTNSLAGGLQVSRKEVIGYLKQAEISAQARAEQLSMDEWHKLYKVITGSH